jgi:hypothetical protein
MKKEVKKREIDITIGTNYSFPQENELSEKYGLIEKNFVLENDIKNVIATKNENDVVMLQKYQDIAKKVDEKNRKIENLCVLLEAVEPIPGFDVEKYRKILDEGLFVI